MSEPTTDDGGESPIVCTVCGTENGRADTFCVKCGAFLEWKGQGSTSQTTEPMAVRPQLSRKGPPPTGPDRPPFEVALADQMVDATPGQQASVLLSAKNISGRVEKGRLAIVGDIGRWGSLDPTEVSLFPGETADSRLTFLIPRKPTPVAGAHLFAVSVTTHGETAESGHVNGQVNVAPFVHITTDIRPRTSRDPDAGRHRVEVSNSGNAPVVVRVAAKDPDDALVITIAPNTLSIAPDSAAIAVVEARVKPEHDRRTVDVFPFRITVEDDHEARETLEVTFNRIAREASSTSTPDGAPVVEPSPARMDPPATARTTRRARFASAAVGAAAGLIALAIWGDGHLTFWTPPFLIGWGGAGMILGFALRAFVVRGMTRAVVAGILFAVSLVLGQAAVVFGALRFRLDDPVAYRVPLDAAIPALVGAGIWVVAIRVISRRRPRSP
jgi:hypothetical protein